MNIKTELIGTCFKELEALLEAVDADASSEHVSDAFHALFGWDPQSLTEEKDFDPSTVEAVELDLRQATRTIAILGKYFAGDLS